VRSLHELYTPRETFAVLRRERARSDRHGREFSLVLLKVEGCLWPSAPTLKLAQIIRERCRGTDEIGRFDVEYLCAILPDTGPGGAWRFAAGICDNAQAHLLRPLCTVYTYPNAWFGDRGPGNQKLPGLKIVPADRQNDSGGAAHDPGEFPAHPLIRTASSLPEGGQALIPFVLNGIESDLTGLDAAQQIEHLLIRPMPAWKRALDVMGASCALVVFSPVMALAAMAVKASSEGPVIFRQRRAGLGGRPFTIYKFRTMCIDAEEQKPSLRPVSEQDGPAFKLMDDPRVTRIGRVLRATSIDELPQLWNVIRGDMSLVGPRPLPVDESNACDPWHRQRLEVTPGLTCIWQVEGRSRVTFDEWMRMDARYIRRRKFWHDFWLLLKTIPAVIFSRGAR
jgi:lipopolysaccharide/colanic/teichoic acid biosynthesis glycosyltransferase